jgi:multidrug efflux pump subunit AcrA (membrane-fusion protein)
MIQKIKNVVHLSVGHNPYIHLAIVASVILGGATGAYVFFFADKEALAEVAHENGDGATPYDTLTAVVGADDVILSNMATPRNSWPGEIISSGLSQVQPQREGVITSWRVRIGDTVASGETLGTISAPPKTPELIAMLAEKTESMTRAKAQATIADEFAATERGRIESLKKSLEGTTASNSNTTFAALELLRKTQENKLMALRSFIERAISNHVLTVTNYTDWRIVRYGGVNKQYGILNPVIQSSYETSLLKLISELKDEKNTPIESAKDYFGLAVRLANSSGDNELTNGFKTTAADDQKDFFEFLSEYREAEAELADKETEYKIMISEKGSMIEKDRTMAHAEAEAAGAAYAKVASEITGGTTIVATRAGTVSAIYKKVGDLVSPDMSIAVIAGRGSILTVRMKVPNNIQKPVAGEIVSVVRPGFSTDVRKAKIVGVGTSLDETGSYMADAVITDRVDWPAGASVRVIASENSIAPFIRFSSIWWDKDGAPQIWKVSDAERIFAQKITVGRILGSAVEVYDGIKNGDRYVISPTANIREDMLLNDLVPKAPQTKNSSSENQQGSSGHENHENMEGM